MNIIESTRLLFSKVQNSALKMKYSTSRLLIYKAKKVLLALIPRIKEYPSVYDNIIVKNVVKKLSNTFYTTELSLTSFTKVLEEDITLFTHFNKNIGKSSTSEAFISEQANIYFTVIRNFSEELSYEELISVLSSKYFSSLFNISEIMSFVFAKMYYEDLGVVSNILKNVDKQLADNLSIQHLFSKYCSKETLNSAEIEELQQKFSSKIYLEEFNVLAKLLKKFDKSLFNTLSIEETIEIIILGGFILRDFIKLGESVNSVVNKSLSEYSILFIDIVNKLVNKPFYNNLVLSEYISYLFNKPILEEFSTSENKIINFTKLMFSTSDISEIRQMFMSKTKEDICAFIEEANKRHLKYAHNSSNITERGTLFNQGYCDPSYFEEYYVGNLRTF